MANARSRLAEILTPSVRLGVTGLSRAGKTVFITALVRNLVTGGRLPFFSPDADGRIVRAYLEPQPDDAVPRFDYEAHLAELFAAKPRWPESTRKISELRVTIEYRSNSPLKRALLLSKLHLDIVDYPGEWLTDLPLLDQDYGTFSNSALALAAEPARALHSKPWRDFVAGLKPDAPQNEDIARQGAELFTRYMKAVRASGALSTLAPGRFLLPGDLEGSPLLTFFPMLVPSGEPGRGTLAGMMQRRFESYKDEVVRPFFTGHFRRLDRQIVLVDCLSALDAGPAALADLNRAMTAILSAFEPGANSWLSLILGKKIDRVLFAATKADHLPASSHDRLSAILKRIVETASRQAAAAGAEVETAAMSALRATKETSVKEGNDTFPCLRGIPVKGEQLGSIIYDGRTEAVIFPGDLPENPGDALDPQRSKLTGSLSLIRFEPPKLSPVNGQEPALPHIRLDRALDYLIADYLS